MPTAKQILTRQTVKASAELPPVGTRLFNFSYIPTGQAVYEYCGEVVKVGTHHAKVRVLTDNAKGKERIVTPEALRTGEWSADRDVARNFCAVQLRRIRDVKERRVDALNDELAILGKWIYQMESGE